MILSVDKYLETLLSFIPRRDASNRMSGDYVSLIHVPADGAEKVYSLSFDEKQPLLTVARYTETVWKILENSQNSETEASPSLDALQATLEADHPVFDYLSSDTLASCQNHSDGGAGLDYYLMLWQKDGQADVVECWEPYGRNEQPWLTVIGALQVLSTQFEYAAAEV